MNWRSCLILRSVNIRTMHPHPIDPHNHAPEATPDDVWGDTGGLQATHGGPATVLPPKRIKAKGSSPAPVGKPNEGLRIEAKTQRRDANDADHRLDVQEIDGSVVRLDPEAPLAPKMPRQITFHERPAKVTANPQQRGEGKDWGRSRQQSFRWILGTGAGVATVVVTAMMLLPLINESNAARPRPAQSERMQAPEDNGEDLKALNAMLARQSEAEQIFRTFASASIADDFLPVIRDAKTVEPLIRSNLRPPVVSKAWIPPEDTRWNVFDAKGSSYGLLEGTLPDYSKFSAYLILSENHLLLDWKASTGYGTATFDELEKNQGDPAEIRARITPCQFYTIVFPETEFQSYQMISPDNEKAIWCYTHRGDPVHKAIVSLFVGGEILKSTPEPKEVTLRLEHAPAGALPNQWLISELLHNSWIIP